MITLKDVQEYYISVSAGSEISAISLIRSLLLKAFSPVTQRVYQLAYASESGRITSSEVMKLTGLNQSESGRHLKLLSDYGFLRRSIEESEGKGPARWVYELVGPNGDNISEVELG